MAQIAGKTNLDVDMTPVEELPALASLAAVELDDLIIGRSGAPRVEALPRLARALSSWIPAEGEGSAALQLDPTRVFVISRAFDDSNPLSSRPAVSIQELVYTTATLTRLLENSERDQSNDDQLKKLRSFCLSLSRRAATLVYSGEESPRHPFRR